MVRDEGSARRLGAGSGERGVIERGCQGEGKVRQPGTDG